MVSRQETIVVYEVLLSLRRLIKKYGHEIQQEWGILLQIIIGMEPYLSMQGADRLQQVLNEILTVIEGMNEPYLILSILHMSSTTIKAFV